MQVFQRIRYGRRQDKKASSGTKFPNIRGSLSKELLHKLAPKKTQFAAVDIGSREIKVVEISTANGYPEVIASGRLPTPAGIGDPDGDEDLVNALNEVTLYTGIQSKEVIATISGDRVITRHIKVPVMPARELETAIMFEAEKFIPIPVDELNIRYLNLGEIESDGERYLHLLLAAVPSSFVYDYYEIFIRAGLVVAAIDVQSLCLWRVFCGLDSSPAREGTAGILDIGAASTQFLVVSDRTLQLSRILPVGGNLLTQSLAENYGLEFKEAQQLKEEQGELLSAEEAAAAAAGAMQMDYSLRAGLSSLVREIRRSLDYYASQKDARLIDRFIISGGTSKLRGFREFFAEAMEAPVDFGNPGIPGLP
ncbi:MAG: type IV pilus assembly protein PilM, partial [Desulfotomaculaceae bacterium]|nr:type IV pilus assembly protein PilM [Desulfotomaculaceae bacterium]